VIVVVDGWQFAERRYNIAVEPGALLDLGDVALSDGVRLRGTVVDESGEPLSGVQVILTRKYVKKDPMEDAAVCAISETNGSVLFRQQLASGEWAIRLQSHDYDSDMPDSSLHLGTSKVNTVEFKMRRKKPKGRIVGHVIDDDDRPLSGVPVIALDTRTQGMLRKNVSDATGCFVLRDIAAGEVIVIIDAGSKYKSKAPVMTNTDSGNVIVLRAQQLEYVDVQVMVGGLPSATPVKFSCSRLRLSNTLGDFTNAHVENIDGVGCYRVYCKDDSKHSLVCLPSDKNVEASGPQVFMKSDKQVVVHLYPRIMREVDLAQNARVSSFMLQLVRVLEPGNGGAPPPRIIDPQRTVFTEFTSKAGGLVTGTYDNGSQLMKEGIMVVPGESYVLVVMDPQDGTPLGWLPIESYGAVRVSDDLVKWFGNRGSK